MEIRHELASAVDPPVAYGKGQQLREQQPQTLAIVGIQRFGAAVGKDGDRVGGDRVDPFEQELRRLLAEVGLDVPVCLVSVGGVAVHV